MTSKCIILSVIAMTLSIMCSPGLARASEALTTTSEASTMPEASEAASAIPADSQCTHLSDLLQQLLNNRKLYNNTNDSIFQKTDRDAWVNLLYRSASRMTDIYNQNKDDIKEIHTLLENASKQGDKQPNNVSLYLIEELNRMINNPSTDFSDPFLLYDISQTSINAIDSLMPQSEYALMANYLKLRYYNEIGQIDPTFNYWKVCILIARRIIDRNPQFEAIASTEAKNDLLGTYAILLSSNYFINDLISLDDVYRYWNQAVKLSNDQQEYISSQRDKSNVKDFLSAIGSLERRVIRNYYLSNHFDLHTPHIDSLVQEQLKDYERQRNFRNMGNFHTYCLFQLYMGHWSPAFTFWQVNSFYKNQNPDLKNITIQNIDQYVNAYTTRIFLTDINPTLSLEQKHQLMKSFCNEIATIFKECKDTQSNNQEVKYATNFMTQKRLLKYLDKAEYREFINQMTIATQIHTYGHSLMVSRLSSIVLNGIITHEPELLTTLPNLRNARQVKKYTQELNEYMLDVALGHDLGKLTIPNIVNNNYRPITDLEYSFVKQHPERGQIFLKVDSVNQWHIHDPMVGHHKWYDGTKGYPASYDNVHCETRIITDILSICDCLEAASNHLGRNYSKYKDFNTLLLELKQGAGTRYNPDIVRVIDSYEDVHDAMEYEIEEHWIDTYYDIYKQYFSRK